MQQDQPKRLLFSSHPASNSANITSAVGIEETAGRQRARRNSLFSRTVIWVTALICVAFLLGALAQAWSNSQLAMRVQAAQQQLAQVQAHHDDLSHLANYYQDPAVIESEARQQFGYVRPGEHAVVVVSTADQPAQVPAKHAPAQHAQSFWQAWWNSLFGS